MSELVRSIDSRDIAYRPCEVYHNFCDCHSCHKDEAEGSIDVEYLHERAPGAIEVASGKEQAEDAHS